MRNSLVIPIARYHGWIGRAWRFSIVPVDDHMGASGTQVLVPATDGIVDLAGRGGVPAELFGGFCEKHLCSESWEFVVVAVHYETVSRLKKGTCGIGRYHYVRIVKTSWGREIHNTHRSSLQG